MSKKAKSKKVKKEILPDLQNEKERLNLDLEQEKPFDFGGLPVRDLKKNLGCG